MLLDVLHLVDAFALKGRVTDGEDLVDDQDLGFEWAATENARRTYIPLE